jgi:hypothetical protein
MQTLSGTPGHHTRKDISGQTFGRWYAVYFDHVDKHGNAMWFCLCACGNEGVIRGHVLRSGKTTSCGCYQKELAKELFTKRWDEYRNRLLRDLFTVGLYPQGKPKEKRK